jgi:hypothetical protein
MILRQQLIVLSNAAVYIRGPACTPEEPVPQVKIACLSGQVPVQHGSSRSDSA